MKIRKLREPTIGEQPGPGLPAQVRPPRQALVAPTAAMVEVARDHTLADRDDLGDELVAEGHRVRDGCARFELGDVRAAKAAVHEPDAHVVGPERSQRSTPVHESSVTFEDPLARGRRLVHRSAVCSLVRRGSNQHLSCHVSCAA